MFLYSYPVFFITYQVPAKHKYEYLQRKPSNKAIEQHMKEILVIQVFYSHMDVRDQKKVISFTWIKASNTLMLSFRSVLKTYGAMHSNSKNGNPYDNAMVEFFCTLKRELVQGANFETPEQAQKQIFEYI